LSIPEKLEDMEQGKKYTAFIKKFLPDKDYTGKITSITNSKEAKWVIKVSHTWKKSQ